MERPTDKRKVDNLQVEHREGVRYCVKNMLLLAKESDGRGEKQL